MKQKDERVELFLFQPAGIKKKRKINVIVVLCDIKIVFFDREEKK